MGMDEILKLRFSKRDKAFTEKLLSIKNEMNARGKFHSGETVKRGHDALVDELTESRKTIVTTISESLRVNKPNKISRKLQDNAVGWLRGMKDFLERYYLEQMKVIVSSLQNKTMLAPYLNLSDVIELNEKELEVELAQEIENYKNSRGVTLYERIKNQFLDRPLVVVAIITVAAVTTILTFLRLLGVI